MQESLETLKEDPLLNIYNYLNAKFREIKEAIKKKDQKGIKPCSGCSWICGRDDFLWEHF